jgi:uncharacterized cofD-like protein
MLSAIDERLIAFAKDPTRGPKIVVIGGGTGLSTLLRGLKLYSNHLTAIVTVADNGGSSGMLREDLGILPPGDIRNCILALADTEPLMADLLDFRFQEGRLQGQSFGNLFIAAMNAISGNFFDAVRNVSKVLAVKGQVLPVSLHNINILAQLDNGETIFGETNIGSRLNAAQADIERITMEPADAKPLPEAIDALKCADLIIIGPGSLYTSIIPHLLFPEITQAILGSQATKIYVCNIMTQPAETYHYTATQHVEAILRHAGRTNAEGLIDYCIVNNQWIEDSLIQRYRLESAVPVDVDQASLSALGLMVIAAPLACVTNGVIRHDHTVLARTALRLMQGKPMSRIPPGLASGLASGTLSRSPVHKTAGKSRKSSRSSGTLKDKQQ